MTIKHSFKTGKTTIELSWLETRQFISCKDVREAVGCSTAELVSGPEPLSPNKIAVKKI